METNEYDFQEFQKISRLSRNCVITEKIDGTNGQVVIVEAALSLGVDESLVIAKNPAGDIMLAGSRISIMEYSPWTG